jgi:hypothetical protein
MKHPFCTIDRRSISLAIIALVLNILFLRVYHHNDYYLGMLIQHGEIGYNLATHGSIKLNNERCTYVRKLQESRHASVDYADAAIDHTRFGRPTEHISPFDVPG